MNESKKDNTNTEDSVSMYLSFADDTMSNTAYNTIESIKDQSMMEYFTDANKTLEAEDKNVSQLKTVETLSPLRPFDNTWFNKLNAMSSTPSSKEKNTTTKITALAPKIVGENQQINADDDGVNDKENAQPDGVVDHLSSSISSYVESSTLECKTLLMTTTTDEESVNELKTSVVKVATVNSCTENINELKLIPKEAPQLQLNDINELKTSVVKVATVNSCTENINDLKLIPKEAPQLQLNDIIPNFSDTETKEEDIKELINKMLKLTENTTKKTSAVKQPVKSTSGKPRNSLLPVLAGGEKRSSFGFKKRMSVLVKTTLNSPARKIARITPSTEQKQRKSIMPPKAGTAVGLGNTRKSVLHTTKPMSTSEGKNTRKSLHPLGVVPMSTKIKTPTSTVSANRVRPSIGANFKCPTCDSTFRIKSLLDAHKRSHEIDGTTPTFVRKAAISNLSGSTPKSNTPVLNGNKCKFCDKNFALERALHIHLMQNCTKIPPGEKRKLKFTDLNHVEKAQLPIFGHGNSMELTTVAKPETPTVDYRKSKILSDQTRKLLMPPPSSSKKITTMNPHAGINRTPTKSVPCHTCKRSFKSILEYTDHCLTVHPTSAQGAK